jgi:hypothetical protein
MPAAIQQTLRSPRGTGGAPRCPAPPASAGRRNRCALARACAGLSSEAKWLPCRTLRFHCPPLRCDLGRGGPTNGRKLRPVSRRTPTLAGVGGSPGLSSGGAPALGSIEAAPTNVPLPDLIVNLQRTGQLRLRTGRKVDRNPTPLNCDARAYTWTTVQMAHKFLLRLRRQRPLAVPNRAAASNRSHRDHDLIHR